MNLLQLLQQNQAPVSEELFATQSLGSHPIADFGSATKGSTGKFSFKVGDYRIGVKAEALTKPQLEVVIFTALKEYKGMKAGDKFIVAQ